MIPKCLCDLWTFDLKILSVRLCAKRHRSCEIAGNTTSGLYHINKLL